MKQQAIQFLGTMPQGAVEAAETHISLLSKMQAEGGWYSKDSIN